MIPGDGMPVSIGGRASPAAGESVDRRSGGSTTSVVFRPQSQHLEQLSVEWRELGLQFHGGLFGDRERVPLHVVEPIKYSPGGSSSAGTPFGIQWQRVDLGLGHLLTQLAFQQGLEQQRKELRAQERHDPCGRMQMLVPPRSRSSTARTSSQSAGESCRRSAAVSQTASGHC